MADPTKIHGGKDVGRIGISQLEKLAPGSRALGKEQQAAMLYQDIAKKQSGLGKGTQVLNAFKPAGYGSIMGGILGGGVPGALVGGAATVMANNPKVLAFGSKALNRASSVKIPKSMSKIASKTYRTAKPLASKTYQSSKVARGFTPENSSRQQPKQSQKPHHASTQQSSQHSH